jgi:hypothetical protein
MVRYRASASLLHQARGDTAARSTRREWSLRDSLRSKELTTTRPDKEAHQMDAKPAQLDGELRKVQGG